MVRPEVARQKIARASTRLEQAESIVCRYGSIDHGRIHAELRQGAAALRRFLAAAARAAGL
jgi:hypothetical protein